MPFDSPLNSSRSWSALSIALILALTLTLTWTSVHWVRQQVLPLPPFLDQAYYLYLSVENYNALMEGGPIGLAKSFAILQDQFGPLYPFSTVFLYLVFGVSRESAYATNAVYLFLLLLFTFLFACRTFGTGPARLAVFLLAIFPATLDHTREYLLEFPLAAFSLMAVYFLWRSDHFQNRREVLLAGVCMGLAFLSKTMAGVYLIGPLLYAVWRTLFSKKRITVASIGNMALGAFVTVAVASPFYVPNWRSIFRYLFHFGYGAGATSYQDAGPLWSLQNLLYYPQQMIWLGVSWPLAVLTAALLVASWKRWTAREDVSNSEIAFRETITWIAMALVTPLLILTFSPNKGGYRFIMPLLPWIAMLMAAVFSRLDRPNAARLSWVASVFAVAFVVCGIGVFSLRTFSASWLPGAKVKGGSYWRSLIESPIATRRTLEHDSQVTGQTSDWQYENILASVEQNASALPLIKNVRATVLPNHWVFSSNGFNYYAALRRSQLRRATRGSSAAKMSLAFTPVDPQWVTKTLAASHFVIAKSRAPFGEATFNKHNEPLLEILARPESGFEKLPQEFALPDGARAVLYRNPANEARFVDSLPDTFSPVQTRYGGSVLLLGYQATSRSKHFLDLALAWQFTGSIREPYEVYVHFLNEHGDIVFQKDHRFGDGAFEIRDEHRGEILMESFRIAIPPAASTAPARYTLRVGVWLPMKKHLAVTVEGRGTRDFIGARVGAVNIP